MESLRRKEGSALGFIPKAVYESVLKRECIAGRDRWRYQDVYITEDNGELTGFCMASFHGSLADIFQIVVRQDARRWHRALLLAEQIEAKARTLGKFGVKCRVARDLESNLFWRAIGYLPLGVVNSTWLNQRESKSRRPLYHYEKRWASEPQLALFTFKDS